MAFRLNESAVLILFYANAEEYSVTNMAEKLGKSFDVTYRLVARLRDLGYIENNSLKNKKTGFIMVSDLGKEYLKKGGYI